MQLAPKHPLHGSTSAGNESSHLCKILQCVQRTCIHRAYIDTLHYPYIHAFTHAYSYLYIYCLSSIDVHPHPAPSPLRSCSQSPVSGRIKLWQSQIHKLKGLQAACISEPRPYPLPAPHAHIQSHHLKTTTSTGGGSVLT